MILCHCRRITERQIARAVEHGAASVEDIARACGAGTECRGCVPALQQILLVGSLRSRSATFSVPASAAPEPAVAAA